MRVHQINFQTQTSLIKKYYNFDWVQKQTSGRPLKLKTGFRKFDNSTRISLYQEPGEGEATHLPHPSHNLPPFPARGQMNNSFIAPSYDGSDPDYRQQARFLQPSYLPTNGPGSENARVAPQPTHPKSKCYHRNHNQNTNSNHQGSSGQTLGSGKKKWRRRGNRNLRDSWDCSVSDLPLISVPAAFANPSSAFPS